MRLLTQTIQIFNIYHQVYTHLYINHQREREREHRFLYNTHTHGTPFYLAISLRNRMSLIKFKYDEVLFGSNTH